MSSKPVMQRLMHAADPLNTHIWSLASLVESCRNEALFCWVIDCLKLFSQRKGTPVPPSSNTAVPLTETIIIPPSPKTS